MQSVLSWGEYIDYESESEDESSSESDTDDDDEEDEDEAEPILKGGFIKLVEFLQKKIEGKVDIITNTKVNNIDWGQERTILSVENGNIYKAR